MTGKAVNGLKPNINVVLGFARDYARGEMYADPVNGVFNGEQVLYSRNYFQPAFTVDTENVNFYTSASGFAIGERFDYTLTVRSYNNDYSYIDDTIPGNKYKEKSISGFVNFDPTTSQYSYNEYGYQAHKFQLRTSAAYDQGPLSLRLRLYTPITLTSQSNNAKMQSINFATNGNLVDGLSEVSSFQFAFQAFAELAARYKAFDNRLVLSMGGRFGTGLVGWVNTDTTTYTRVAGTDSRVKASDSKTTSHITNIGTNGPTGTGNTATANPRFAADFRCAFLFYLTPNFAIDAATGIQNGAFDVFGTTTQYGVANGLFSFGQVMIHLYF